MLVAVLVALLLRHRARREAQRMHWKNMLTLFPLNWLLHTWAFAAKSALKTKKKKKHMNLEHLIEPVSFVNWCVDSVKMTLTIMLNKLSNAKMKRKVTVYTRVWAESFTPDFYPKSSGSTYTRIIFFHLAEFETPAVGKQCMPGFAKKDKTLQCDTSLAREASKTLVCPGSAEKE